MDAAVCLLMTIHGSCSNNAINVASQRRAHVRPPNLYSTRRPLYVGLLLSVPPTRTKQCIGATVCDGVFNTTST